MTYNLLADYFASKDFCQDYMYFHAVPCALELDYRKLLFVKEILGEFMLPSLLYKVLFVNFA